MKFIYIFLFVCVCISTASAQTGGVGINRNGSAPDPSALLDLNDTLGGVLFPRLSTAQRNALANPANGLFIFNTSTRCFEVYNLTAASWQSMYCQCNFPAPPVAQPATNVGFSSFTANWQLVPGATAYFLDLAYDSTFNFILPGYSNYFVGNQNSAALINLPCDTTLYYRVRSGINCGSGQSSNVRSVRMGTCVYCTRIGTNSGDYARGIYPMSDGGFIVNGGIPTDGAGDWDHYVARVNFNQTFAWKKSIGGSSTDYVEAGGSAQTLDGGIITTGYSTSFTIGSSGYYRFYATKVDQSGTVVWKTVVGNNNTTHQYGRAAAGSPDGGVVLAGYSSGSGWTAGGNDFNIIKLDVNGNFQWARRFGTSNEDVAADVAVASDGSIYVTGYVNSGSSYDIGIAKFDASGNFQWGKRVGGNSDEYGTTCTVDASGNVYVAGYGQSFSAGSWDFYMAKVDPSGNLVWTKVIGGGSSDLPYDVHVNGNDLYVTGETNSFGLGASDMLVLKLDLNGTLQRAVCVGTTGSDVGFAINTNSSGSGVMVAGYSDFQTFGSTDFYVAKLDNQLVGCCSVVVNPIQNSGGTLNNYGSSATISSVFSTTGGIENTPASIQVICN